MSQNKTTRIRLLIADDHTILRQGLRLILSEDPELEIVGEAKNGAEAVVQALTLNPDVVLMDVKMPEWDGVEATRRIRAAKPGIQILMLTVSDHDQDLMGALQAGARGYLLKSAQAREVLEAIHRIHKGEAVLPPDLAGRVMEHLSATPHAPESLTEREVDVLRFVAHGLSNKEIAGHLQLTENTVKTHMRHILEKLNLRSRAEAAAYAVQAGLLPPHSIG